MDIVCFECDKQCQGRELIVMFYCVESTGNIPLWLMSLFTPVISIAKATQCLWLSRNDRDRDR